MAKVYNPTTLLDEIQNEEYREVCNYIYENSCNGKLKCGKCGSTYIGCENNYTTAVCINCENKWSYKKKTIKPNILSIISELKKVVCSIPSGVISKFDQPARDMLRTSSRPKFTGDYTVDVLEPFKLLEASNKRPPNYYCRQRVPIKSNKEKIMEYKLFPDKYDFEVERYTRELFSYLPIMMKQILRSRETVKNKTKELDSYKKICKDHKSTIKNITKDYNKLIEFKATHLNQMDKTYFKKFVDSPSSDNIFVDVTSVELSDNKLIISTRLERISPFSYHSTFRDSDTYTVEITEDVMNYLNSTLLSSKQREIKDKNTKLYEDIEYYERRSQECKALIKEHRLLCSSIDDITITINSCLQTFKNTYAYKSISSKDWETLVLEWNQFVEDCNSSPKEDLTNK